MKELDPLLGIRVGQPGKNELAKCNCGCNPERERETPQLQDSSK